MRLTVLGCSGSIAGPEAPASGYLISTGGPTDLLMDAGSGVLGELQRHRNPATVDVVLTHLHPDHCLDIPGLLVWRRFHPTLAATDRNALWGPADTARHLGQAGSDGSGVIDDITDTFEVHPVTAGLGFEAGGVQVEAFSMVHPCEAYGYRVTDPASGAVLAYTGDTAWTDNLVDLARGADVLLAEATWCGSGADKAPGMHLDGAEAGRAARMAGVAHLVLVHIPPYGDRGAALAAARSEFAGPITLGNPGMVLDLP